MRLEVPARHSGRREDVWMIRRSSIVLLVVVLAAVAAVAAGEAGILTEDQVAAWRGDLDYLEGKLAEVHPDPYHLRNREEVAAEFADLGARLPELEAHEAVVALGEIVASIGDGHTRLTWPLAEGVDFTQGHSSTPPPHSKDLLMHQFPVRLGVYEEGIFVEGIDARYRDEAGSRVVAIGDLSVEEAIARVEPVIRHDNEWQILDLLPETLALAEVLHARGVIEVPSRARWTFEQADGRISEVLLSAVGEGADITWASAFAETGDRHLSQRYLAEGRAPRRGLFSRKFWFDWLPEDETVYLQLNEVYNEEDETLFDFSRKLRRFVAGHPVEKLIIDLRFNWGGNNSLALPILHAVIGSDELRRPGAVFVIIGRGTFSAAMMLAVDLERHVSPIFVGEPTGSSPNHFGDSRKIELPATGLTVRMSTLYWQRGGPGDDRAAIRPLLVVPPRWADQIAGRDAAVDTILERPGEIDLAAPWRGELSLGGQEVGVEVDSLAAVDGTPGSMTSESWGFFPPGTTLRIELASDESPVRFSAVEESGFEFLLEGVVVGRRIVGHLVQPAARGNAYAFMLEQPPPTASEPGSE